jgi:hypothetical protein
MPGKILSGFLTIITMLSIWQAELQNYSLKIQIPA